MLPPFPHTLSVDLPHDQSMTWQLHQFTLITHDLPHKKIEIIKTPQVICSECKTNEFCQRYVHGLKNESGTRPPLHTNCDPLP